MHPGYPDAGPAGARKAASASLAAMNWLNFLTALMQTAFGAFLSVYLTTNGWSATDIGAVLGVGTVVAIACQVPGGAMLDWLHRTRLVASLAVTAIMASAALMAAAPQRIPVLAAEFLQGAGASVLTPAIAALTLAISRHEKLGEKFGHNVRYAAVGSAVAAMVIGAAAQVSDAAGFWLAMACGVPRSPRCGPSGLPTSRPRRAAPPMSPSCRATPGRRTRRMRWCSTVGSWRSRPA
ncbi:MFS transporter [Rhodopila globiformis]|uniref:Major facilitator superfamily (MFS) profile domain-containing protein n=1 Tax=Rhodopila globiformis TaxID=1071 RepID=A0A2S6NMP2_RHOGL|nr:MFS transporter [Rhodopila globiformis]PPQ37658.1 hypothetical protein CCS01_03255 [Rhodopila globiformis]